jgi:hypothetical protein
MKKTLLLAAALACSGVAQAETYVCTSTYGDKIVLEKSLGTDESGATFIADIDKGLRSPTYDGTDKLYSGECGKYDVLASGDGFSCTSKFGDSVKAILINISDLTFTGSSLYRDNARVYSGNCVVI